MANWQTPLWISILCFVTTACGVGPSQPDTSAGESPAEGTPEAVTEKTTDQATKADPSPTESTDPSQALTATPLSDTLVIPGERVGPVTRDTSRQDLVDMFGEAALADTEIAVGEGFTESGTTVNLGTEQAFSVIWVDNSQSQPATVKDFGSAWQTPEGIQIGTPFADLQTILGEFDLYGFGWDYGGTIVLEGSELSNYYGLLILRLQPADSATFQQQPDAMQAVQGDKLIASTDPNLASLDLVVSEMIVYLNPPVE
jgi:hypothetical protein